MFSVILDIIEGIIDILTEEESWKSKIWLCYFYFGENLSNRYYLSKRLLSKKRLLLNQKN